MEDHAKFTAPFESSAQDAGNLVSSSPAAAHIPGAILNNSLCCELVQALKLCSGNMEAILDAIFYLVKELQGVVGYF